MFDFIYEKRGVKAGYKPNLTQEELNELEEVLPEGFVEQIAEIDNLYIISEEIIKLSKKRNNEAIRKIKGDFCRTRVKNEIFTDQINKLQTEFERTAIADIHNQMPNSLYYVNYAASSDSERGNYIKCTYLEEALTVHIVGFDIETDDSSLKNNNSVIIKIPLIKKKGEPSSIYINRFGGLGNDNQLSREETYGRIKEWLLIAKEIDKGNFVDIEQKKHYLLQIQNTKPLENKHMKPMFRI